jgi:hypothetical protein
MAGYILYSLDWDKFQEFVNNPTDKQLLGVAKLITEGLGGDDDEFDEELPPRAWPNDRGKTRDLVKERLARPDWYGDLSEVDKSAWSSAISGFCSGPGGKTVGFRVDNNGIYWTALDLAWKQLNVPPDQIVPGVALSTFGRRPFRYFAPAEPQDRQAARLDDDDDELVDDYGLWTMHSMHTPDDVREMLGELRSVRPTIESARNKDALRDYESLVSTLEKIEKEGRMLFVQVDT